MVRRRSDEDGDLHDRHGVPRCKHCGTPTAFASFARTAGSYGKGADDRSQRSQRRGDQCQQLRANTALLSE